MLRSRAARWIALGTVAVLVGAAGVAVAAEGGRGEGRRGRGPKKDRVARLLRGRADRAREGRERRLRAMKNLLEASDAQAKTALEAAQEIARLREGARAKAAAVLVRAFREGKDAAPEARARIREETRAKLRALREECRAPAVEAGMKVVKALTPEQRKRIEDAAAAKGRSVDDAKLARFFALRLASPWAVDLLQARLGP